MRRFSCRYIIIDEAHRIKNENSLLSKNNETLQEDNKIDFKKLATENWIEPPKRELKHKQLFIWINLYN
ncbi:hypothetical protein KFK09_014137 [Dendrobium nobile]|uniref:Uncharacterized protein n=1 Tax=Dendrobium nobile TaxID=94219 RepID=A0A8T3BC43_DENNO|nr:hypothetical protein KFK09_014137 [Dendrobium nobile]